MDNLEEKSMQATRLKIVLVIKFLESSQLISFMLSTKEEKPYR